MSQQRLALWNAEEDLEEEVDMTIALDGYNQNVQYEDCKHIFVPLRFEELTV